MSTARRLSLLAATGLAAGLAAAPALAQTIAAPAGDAGFWAGVNGWLSPIAATWVAGAATWAVARFHRSSNVADRAALTADVRDTATTGLFLAAHEMEVAIDGALPREKREELIVRGVDWVLQRLPGPLGRLGFAEPVVRGIVIKMLGQIIQGGSVEGDTVLNLPALPSAAPLLQGWTREPAAAGQPAADPVGDAVAAVAGGLGSWTREPAAAGQPAADPVGDAVAAVAGGLGNRLSAVEATPGGLAAGILPSPKA